MVDSTHLDMAHHILEILNASSPCHYGQTIIFTGNYSNIVPNAIHPR